MARARNIKPDFFTDEEIVELEPLTRLMFIGMWTMADRCGRMEDKPKQIKLRILPVDNINVETALNDLQTHNLILRYRNGNKRYIQIINFEKHQSPHKDERQSLIPPPKTNELHITSDEHGASMVQAPGEHGAKRPDCLNLIPDCLNLIPESTKHPTTRAEKSFIECFAQNENRIRQLYPQADYETERELCIAHYRARHPPVDCYPVILKWFQRVPKPKSAQTERDAILKRNAESCRDFCAEV